MAAAELFRSASACFPAGCYNRAGCEPPFARWEKTRDEIPAPLQQRGTCPPWHSPLQQQVRPQVEAGNHGRIVALDVDTGAFEVAEDTLTASRRLLALHPDAQIWCVRIGHPAVHRFGPRVRAVRT